ncbi:MAG: hypothetical protein QM658_03085, partial [Gordonia sp. (in: high G+C Gram-positive bacteria)]
MTAPWADARVEAHLDWGDIDTELRTRLERSVAVASRQCQVHFSRLAQHAARQAKQISRSFETEFRQVTKASQQLATKVRADLAAAGGTIKVDLDDAQARTKLTALHARVQDLTGQTLNLRLDVDTAAAMARVRAGHAQMQAFLTANPLRVGVDLSGVAEANTVLSQLVRDRTARIDVDLQGAAAAEARLALLAQTRTSTVNVDVDRRASGVLGRIGSSLTGLGRSALSAGASVLKFGALAGTAVVAAGSLVPVVAALGSALAAVGGAAGVVAVGGLFAAVAGAAALKTAFSGLDDVMKNMFDPEKAEDFEKAMAKLTPSAQSTMRAVQGLGKAYSEIVKKPVQEAMFAGLAPKIAQLGRLLPSVRDSLVDVAQGFNDGAVGALRMINSARGMAMMKSLLGDAGRMGSNFGAAITSAVPGFLALGSAATRVLAPMTDGIGGMASKWSETMMRMQQTGELQAKMQSLMNTAKQVGQVLGQVGSAIAGVFRAASAAGNGNPLGGLLASVTSISEWINGPGQAALTSFFQSTTAAMGAVLPVLLQVAGIIGGQVAPMIAQLAVQLGPVLQTVVSGLGLAVAALEPAIAPLGDALSAIGNALAPVLPIVGQLLAQFVQLAGPIIGALASALGPILQALGGALTSALQALMPAIAPIQQVFAALSPVLAQVATLLGQVLSQAITALMPIVTAIGQAFAAVLPAIEPLLDVLGGVLMQILQAIAPVIEQLAGAWGEMAGVVGGALAQAMQAIAPAFQSLTPIISQVGEILGQLAGTYIDAVVQVINMLAPMLPQIADAFMQILTAVMPLVPVLLQLATSILQPIIQLIPTLVQVIVALLPIIVQLAGLFAALITNAMPLISFLAQVIGFFAQLLGTIINFAATALATIIGWVANIIAAFVGMVTSVVSTVGGWVTSIVGFFGDLISQGLAKAQELWSAVSTAFSEGVGKAVDFVKELPGKITSALSGAGQWLVDVGKQAIEGLISGLKSMLGSIGSAIVSLFPGPIQGAVRGALGLALGGVIPGLASGGLLGLLGGGEVTGASTTIAPGGFIVNAAATRRNRALLNRLSPKGRVLSGPGTGTSDSITGTFRGRALARVSRGEFYVPPDEAAGIMPLLMAVNAGRRLAQFLAAGGGLPAFAPGGMLPRDLLAAARDAVNSGYVWGGWGNGWNTDCSGLTSSLANMASGKASGPGTGERTATGGMSGFLQARGFMPGMGPDGSLRVGWSDTHANAQLPTGENIEHTGPQGSPASLGANAKGPDSMPNQMHLPMGGDTSSGALGTNNGTGGTGGTPSTSSSGSTSYGNAGGSSSVSSVSAAKSAGLTPVWVENWPSNLGAAASVPTGNYTSSVNNGAPTGVPSGSAKDLKKGASKQDMVAE